MNGTFDYNKTPLAPPGTKVLVYEPPSLRKTWSAHCVEGWYLGPAPNHYRCHRCFVTKTRSERISNTVKFLPHSWRMPTLSSRDAAIEAAEKLAVALNNPHPASILAPLKVQQKEALEKLAEIFNCAVDFESNDESRVRTKSKIINPNIESHDKSIRKTTIRPRVSKTNETDTIQQNELENARFGGPNSVETSVPQRARPPVWERRNTKRARHKMRLYRMIRESDRVEGDDPHTKKLAYHCLHLDQTRNGQWPCATAHLRG